MEEACCAIINLMTEEHNEQKLVGSQKEENDFGGVMMKKLSLTEL